MMLPVHFILGAAKCGTSSLAVNMARAGMYLPPGKEPNYFAYDKHYARGEPFYASFYRAARSGQPGLDASPQYLLNRYAPERLWVYDQARDGRCRFVVILRNPIDRAYSAYWQARVRGDETRTFEDALQAERERGYRACERRDGRTLGAYVEGGLYANQLRRWLAHWPQDRFRLLLTEDMKGEATALLGGILNFYGLAMAPPQRMEVVNEAAQPRSHRLNDLLRKWPRAKRWVNALDIHPMHRHRIKQWVDRFNMKTVRPPPMREDTRRLLADWFAEDRAALESMMGRSLEHWR